MRLLCETHKILLSGVRGERKRPGEIRTSQNWIGGSGPSDAFFVPPHCEELPNLLRDLEFFWDNDKLEIPEIIKAAISHYQFETIHPFLDGNGRIGRLLITLYLIDKKILVHPVLYLSDFLVRNKGSYYDSSTVVRHSHNIEQWVLFFLNGVIETSRDSIKTFEKIRSLRQDCEDKVYKFGRVAPIGSQLLSHLYSRPIVDVKEVMEVCDITHQTANSIVKRFIGAEILEEITGYNRNRTFAFKAYLDIFR